MLGVDAHSDLLDELVFAEHTLGEHNPFRVRWQPVLEAGDVGLQVCAIWVDPALGSEAALREVFRLARSFHQVIAANSAEVFAVKTRSDLDAVGHGRIGLLLSLEGAAPLQPDIWLIDVMADLGVRMATPTWNEQNLFASGSAHSGGLTRLGIGLVDRLLERGMVLDLAHASPRTFWDALERDCADRVVVSHASCRAIHDHPRNLDDDQLRALAEAGGVLGLMPHPIVVDPSRATIDQFVAHVDHAVSVMGVDHVALGGDFLRQIVRTLDEQDDVWDGVPADAAIEGLESQRDYPALAGRLRACGWQDGDLEALFSRNLLRILAQTLPG